MIWSATWLDWLELVGDIAFFWLWLKPVIAVCELVSASWR